MLLYRLLTANRANALNTSTCPVLLASSAVVPFSCQHTRLPLTCFPRSLVSVLRRERDGRHIPITSCSAFACPRITAEQAVDSLAYILSWQLPVRRFGPTASSNIPFYSSTLHRCPLPLCGDDGRHVFSTLRHRPLPLFSGDDVR